MATTRAQALSTIPELLLEHEESKAQEECAVQRRDNGSIEDEGYGSEVQRQGIDSMLDNLAEMSRRLSLAPSELLGIDEALQASVDSDASVGQSLSDEHPKVGLESLCRTLRQELTALRNSRDEARADSIMLLAEISKKASELEARDAKIKKLKAELSSERKSGKQLQEAMEDLLAWVDSNRSAELAMPQTSKVLTRQREIHHLLERVDDIPTYGVAFRSGSSNKVTVWKVQVVQSYEKGTGLPVYYHGRHLPKTLKSYVKFLQFWCSDRLPESTASAICLWCHERGVQTVWHRGLEAKRPCRECALRGRHCFAVAAGILKCLPIRDIGGFLKGDT